ncbi:MAG: hypothetical protein WBB69_09410 [Anaerolineales bacterium]
MRRHQALGKKSVSLLSIGLIVFTLSCNIISLAIFPRAETPSSNIPEPVTTQTKSPTPIVVETITPTPEELSVLSIWREESYLITFEFSYDPLLWEVDPNSGMFSKLVSLTIDNCSLFPEGGRGFSEDWTFEMEQNYLNDHNLRKGTLLDNYGQVQGIYYYPDEGMFGLEISNNLVECASAAEEVIITYRQVKIDE